MNSSQFLWQNQDSISIYIFVIGLPNPIFVIIFFLYFAFSYFFPNYASKFLYLPFFKKAAVFYRLLMQPSVIHIFMTSFFSSITHELITFKFLILRYLSKAFSVICFFAVCDIFSICSSMGWAISFQKL